ncbi:cobalamin-5-phosphate synthase [Thermanaerovibrio velox DSM 12556]|uniref:Adenosylcobinamide-GDP ribazoletransferase n=1 Tax=Thermanaerovibrio velox DSM 12556 TaxID=926567 RepID=H0UR49_9BACT|nr:cobalamin-5-phosphate synthase [Thermanaerovibrio velox DSM 12556]
MKEYLVFVPRGFMVMWNLLTRLPRLGDSYPTTDSPGVLALGPLVGLVMGLMVGTVGLVAFQGLPGLLTGALCGSAYSLLGWSLHLDGFADLWDGLGSGRRGDAMREVMKDSRSGAFGVMGMVLGLLAWCSACGDLRGVHLPLGLALAGALGRFSLLACAFLGRYPWVSGLGGVFVGRLKGPHLALGALWCAPFAIVLPWPLLLGLLGLSGLLGALMAIWMNQRMGGVNGDVLGACEVLGEIGVLAILAKFI